MKLVQIGENEIKGISVRTTNANEVNQETAKIGGLWKQFYEEIAPNLKSGAKIFGVYHNYESDASGEFSVLAGADGINESSTNSIEKVSILSGKYLLFEAKGEMPQVVIDTWVKIWNYFLPDDSDYQRAYSTDFELYKSQTKIEIYIAVK